MTSPLDTHLLPAIYPALRKDYDPELPVHLHNLRYTVWIARVIDVSRQTTTERRIHHPILVQPEHVDSSVLNGKEWEYKKR